MESAIHIPYDLRTNEGKKSCNLGDESILDSVEFLPIFKLQGDDASCHNLNQVEQPSVLGIEVESLNRRASFSFVSLLDGLDRLNPWIGLKTKWAHNTIPAYLDQTVITWGIQKKLGDTLHYVTESGEPLNVVISGGLKNSVFQGNVLIDAEFFKEYFPSNAEAGLHLIDVGATDQLKVQNILDENLQDYGPELEYSVYRLRSFNSVNNTYLNVFMVLAALAVLIGTIGFGILLVRNKMERKSEMALLLALGFRSREISKLFFMEQIMQLFIGLLAGTLGAFVAILPSLLSENYDFPGLFLLFIIIMILTSGIIWISAASRIQPFRSLVESLQSE